MARFTTGIALAASLWLVAFGDVAFGQIGSIFGEPPPRPPAGVPGRSPGPSIFQPEPPSPPPPPRQAQPRNPRAPADIQTQPLTPPPGAIAIEPPASESPQGRTPGQRGPGLPPPPGTTALQSGDEVVVAPPAQKVVNPTAVFSGLDKITGRIINFDVEINETVQFGALQVTPRACHTRPPTESPNTTGFLEVDEVTLQGEVRRIFTGWMFASSPGLHAVEHPIYDVWLTDCKGGKSEVAETPTPAPTPAAAPVKKPPRQATPPRPPPPQRQPTFGAGPIR
jgi:hypothetical protein